jgi:hypothetical protein
LRFGIALEKLSKLLKSLLKAPTVLKALKNQQKD